MPTRPSPLILHSEAEAEMQESVTFYRERGGDRLAKRFKQHVEAAFHAIVANPERFPPAPDLPGVQKFRLKHFPFSILYVQRPDYIWIVAVAHGSRKPGYWKHRVH
jgi:toxin ParE1/3/4